MDHVIISVMWQPEGMFACITARHFNPDTESWNEILTREVYDIDGLGIALAKSAVEVEALALERSRLD